MVTTRQTRDERKAQTRADLLAAARRVFLERGFHGATLDEIAEEAGYTKGAVYSNFEGKDALFLGLLHEHYAQRAEVYAEFLFEEQSPEETYRAVARLMLEADAREPAWTPLLSEFMVHASRHDALRGAVVEIRERFLDAMASIIERLAAHHGVEYTLPAKEIARGASALARGIFLERLTSLESVPLGTFEEMHAAYMRGLAEPLAERSSP
jgi:AcrR family transcriptional regulator